MSISGIYAVTSQVLDASFNTGLVDIELETYKIDSSNNEVAYGESSTNVMPGEVVSLIPKLNNLAEDCYARIKINYINASTDFNDYVTGFSTNFTKYGDYYYYNGTLTSGQTVKIFDTIKIPEDVELNTEIELEIIAEAIQERNFEPDYTLSDPWKNVTPTKSTRSSYDIYPEIGSANITVVYNDNTNNDITVNGDFWNQIDTVMPGDTLTGNISINNSNKGKAKYFVELSLPNNSAEELELLNKVNLLITNKNGDTVYEGKLLNGGKLLLGEYNSNDFDNLIFKVLVPNELGNDYTLLNPELLLIFSSEYEEKSSDKSINPKTGDTIDLAIAIFLLSSIGLIITMFLSYRERKKEEY